MKESLQPIPECLGEVVNSHQTAQHWYSTRTHKTFETNVKPKPSSKKIREINRGAVFTEENFIVIKKKAHLENNCLLHEN